MWSLGTNIDSLYRKGIRSGQLNMFDSLAAERMEVSREKKNVNGVKINC